MFQRGQSTVLVQNWPVFHIMFLGNIGHENVLYDILERKNTFNFQAINRRSSKRRRIDNFPRGLVHGFGPKLAIFSPHCCRQYRPRKCVLSYSRTKKHLSRIKNQEVPKVEKLTMFQSGQSTVLVQNWPFLHLIVVGNIGQENVFYDILERENTFLRYKNKKFKKSRN